MERRGKSLCLPCVCALSDGLGYDAKRYIDWKGSELRMDYHVGTAMLSVTDSGHALPLSS